jgi:2,5-diamino-6-(ribosylamino)-4(3H)-pyrimidinone 5'-phosphate reductase
MTKAATKRRVEKLRARGAQIIFAGGKEVDLKKLLERLYALGVRRLLLEGGSTLNWGMLRRGLVDEIRVAVAPRIVGGVKAKTLVGGSGFAEISKGVALKLIAVNRVGEDLLLTYKVRGASVASKAR